MSKKNTDKVVLITGASSGIGLDTAKILLSKGYKVYGAARRTELLQELEKLGGHGLFLDITDDASIQNCVNEIISKEKRIDILINNAGYGLGGPIENIPLEEAKKQFEVNVFGLARITQLVLPYMRQNKEGRIVNVSSIAGKFSSPFLGWYHAAKYSVEAFSDALRLEVANFGIKVVIIEPGLIKTNWGIIAADYIQNYSENSAYAESGKNVSDFYRHYYQGNHGASKPSVISRVLVKASTVRKPAIRYKAGKFSTLFILAVKLFSDSFMDFIKKVVYKL